MGKKMYSSPQFDVIGLQHYSVLCGSGGPANSSISGNFKSNLGSNNAAGGSISSGSIIDGGMF